MKPVKYDRISVIPGRVRLYVPEIHKSRQYASNVECHLSNTYGVVLAKASHTTGRVLIIYNESLLNMDDLAALLSKDMDLTNGCNQYPDTLRNRSGFLPFPNTIMPGLLLLYNFLRNWLSGRQFFSRSFSLFNIESALAFYAGYPIFKKSLFELLRSRKVTQEALIASAVITSLLSGQSTLGLFILFFHSLFNTLKFMLSERINSNIRRFTYKLSSSVFRVSRNGNDRIEVAGLKIGDIIRLNNNNISPADGVITTGKAIVDQSPVTGEAIPVFKNLGDSVYAGTIIKAGIIELRVTKVNHPLQTTGEITKSGFRNLSPDDLSYTLPSKMIFYYFLFSIFILILTRDFARFAFMLAAAYPYGADLSLLYSIDTVIKSAFCRSILIKNPLSVLKGARVNSVVFDKTGTLTAGKPEINHIVPLDGNYSSDDIISIAASCEYRYKHPLSEAILEEAKNRDISFSIAKNSRYSIGEGVSAVVGNKKITIGSYKFMKKRQINIDIYQVDADILSRLGISIVYIAADRKPIGLIGVSDKLKEQSTEVIRSLRALGILDLYIVTGDSYQHSFKTSQELGIGNLYASMLPEEKEALINKLKKDNVVAMVGDGINDSEALNQSDVSILISDNISNLPNKIGDASVIGDNIKNIPAFFRLCKYSRQINYQNLIISTGISATALGAASISLINPLTPGALHIANTLLLYLNSKRILNYDKKSD